jgi:hypothetical protein
MKSNLPKLIKETRHDLSDWLWHFTRRDGQPFKVLKEIVQSNHIRGSQDKYCTQTAVCLTEMPLTEAYRQSGLLDEYSYSRFSDYGIGFKKNWIAKRGGLPVIYQPNNMVDLLDPTIRWRHCELDYSKGIDFTWQREWRVSCDRLTFTPDDDVLIVVQTGLEALEIATEDIELDHERDEVFFDVVWSYITHSELAAAKRPVDIEILRTASR